MDRRKHYLRPGKDLILDWRPLYRELKMFVLPSESGGSHPPNVKRNIRTLTKMCTFAQSYFDPKEIPAIMEELLPFFSTSFSENAFVVVGLLNLLFPTHPAPEDMKQLLPQEHFADAGYVDSGLLIDSCKRYGMCPSHSMEYLPASSRLKSSRPSCGC